MTQPAIEIDGISKRFGRNEVLRGLTLDVSPGETFAFLGRNATGKTTTIRMLLGLLKPDAGRIRVLGLDPRRQSIEVRRRVGYLAEDQTMYGWMKVEGLLSFLAPFYPTWDHSLAGQLLAQFDLPPDARVRNLSKGQRVRLGLVAALAHRPELVILDDPTLGLDPIMRRELNRDLITHLQGEGRTVFYSSHLLDEVEGVADTVAILDGGKILKRASTESLRQGVKRLVFDAHTFARADVARRALDVRRSGDEVAVTLDDAQQTIAALVSAELPHRVVDLNLDEIFEAYVAGRREDAQEPPLKQAVAAGAL